MNKKPNIVFIFTDDQRYNTINALGNKQIKTPNMDKLVNSGSSFVNAHIPSGTSGAVCMPSRAMLFTGKTLFNLQQEGQSISCSHITMGETLRNHGYNCYGIGKWHNSPDSFNRCFNNGDNIFFGGMWDHWNVPVNKYDPTGKYDNVKKFTANFFYDNHPVEFNCDEIKPGIHSSELMTDTALEFLDNHDKNTPYFLYTAYLAPHDPRTMPDKFHDMYNPDDIDLPPNYLEQHPFDFGIADIRDEVLAGYPRNENEIKKHIAEYYGMISHLDYQIGRILHKLEQTDELDNTIIILAGDNGLAVGCHGLMGKQNHYEHSIRVPLIMCGPSIPKNVQNSQYVYLLDIFPTLCDMLGFEIPSSVDGKSFSRVFSNPDYISREKLYFAYTDQIRSVKDNRYKLIEYRIPYRHTQLFDLENDPNELNDLHDNSQYANIIESLRNDMEHFRDEWNETSHRLGKNFWSKY